ncbi:exodeoxyribonuclease V subunit gamma, partial [Thermodesulfobacteriota bacterium]
MTSGLKIFTSNRLEILAEQLARNVSEPLSAPLASEVIVVQSKGMQRWVSMELARHNGVCANCSFPFPNAFLHETFRKMIPDLPEVSLFDPGILTFKIMKLLPECLGRPQFKSLQSYLKDDPRDLKLFQLSEKIADRFDQYLIFRPEMIFNWEAGREDYWQAILWRQLAAGIEKQHRAWLRKTLIESIRNQSNHIQDLPERISIFGLSYLPPFHMQVFAEISRLVPVYLFLMSPCKEYWADIVSDREMQRIKAKYNGIGTGLAAEDLHLEKGNRLLASMGALGRDFFRQISANDFDVQAQFQDPGGDNLLTCIQSDIMNLRDQEPSPYLKADDYRRDQSIQIHSCHGPMREIEILYDNLLDMFESDPDLCSKDIIVMTPDIEAYAPFIRAVFDVQDDVALRIPFSIADQSLKKESRVIDAFLSILDLKDSRLGAAKVFALLEFATIRAKFGLSEAEMEKIEHWIKDTNIRWGRDAAGRRRFGINGFSENTWKAGLERLLLGYALPGGEKNMFNGILPYDHIEGGDNIILGKFVEFMDQLFVCLDMLDKDRKLDSWNIILNNILELLCAPAEEVEAEFQILRGILDEMALAAEHADFHEEIAFQVLQSFLEKRLERELLGFGFIAGGVTFCAMLPMRSIPFRVIGLVGLNSDAFPRESRSLGFDLIARNPKPGDRSRRNDDKYLFLEALLSARDKLYISYEGQSIQDNTLIPPSVLVSELLDYIKSGFGVPEDQIVTHHPLQAFSLKYFNGDGPLFSYSKENLLAATSLCDNDRATQNPTPFISSRLSVTSEELNDFKQINIDDLCAFFNNPTKFILQRRLDIYL